MDIKCPKCGQFAADTYKYCPHCGSSLTLETTIVNDESQYNRSENSGSSYERGQEGQRPPFQQQGQQTQYGQQQAGRQQGPFGQQSQTQQGTQTQQGSTTNPFPFPGFGQNKTGNGTATTSVDKSSLLLNVISFIIPLVGIIAYFIYRTKAPKKGKAALIAALCGVVFNLLFNGMTGNKIGSYYGLF